MKLKHTTARKANTRFAKNWPHNAIYSMSVAARRKAGIFAPDSADYDERHGVALSPFRKRTKRLFGFLNRRTAQSA